MFKKFNVSKLPKNKLYFKCIYYNVHICTIATIHNNPVKKKYVLRMQMLFPNVFRTLKCFFLGFVNIREHIKIVFKIVVKFRVLGRIRDVEYGIC